jgi:hypothetical protein
MTRNFRSRDVAPARVVNSSRPGVGARAMRGATATKSHRLSEEERLDWLRLIRSENVGPRGIMAQTPQAKFRTKTSLSR